jgi:hypothetical protein
VDEDAANGGDIMGVASVDAHARYLVWAKKGVGLGRGADEGDAGVS